MIHRRYLLLFFYICNKYRCRQTSHFIRTKFGIKSLIKLICRCPLQLNVSTTGLNCLLIQTWLRCLCLFIHRCVWCVILYAQVPLNSTDLVSHICWPKFEGHDNLPGNPNKLICFCWNRSLCIVRRPGISLGHLCRILTKHTTVNALFVYKKYKFKYYWCFLIEWTVIIYKKKVGIHFFLQIFSFNQVLNYQTTQNTHIATSTICTVVEGDMRDVHPTLDPLYQTNHYQLANCECTASAFQSHLHHQALVTYCSHTNRAKSHCNREETCVEFGIIQDPYRVDNLELHISDMSCHVQLFIVIMIIIMITIRFFPVLLVHTFMVSIQDNISLILEMWGKTLLFYFYFFPKSQMFFPTFCSWFLQKC